MSKEIKWFGPHKSPFVAAVQALDDQNIDISEFTSYRMWNMAGVYNFFDSAGDFVEDLCAFIAKDSNVVVQRRDDGFYAAYDVKVEEPTSGGTLRPCPFCGSAEAVVNMPYAEADWIDHDDDNDGAVVICNVNAGGCGTSSGWAEDADKAAELWNRRAS